MFISPNATPPAQTGGLRRRTRATSPPDTPRCATTALPAQECRVPGVRRFTRALLASWGVTGDDLDSAVLIVGELAANAARHGHADMALALVLTDRVLSVEIVDSGEPNGHPHPPCADDEHGRGLAIVEHLAESIDIREEPRRHTTHATLRLV
ncbi:ATP-binding protein [Embleya scabrispora]|uniref:ATP-binding protein n=1 Tax=Embleya scabrispora TaxID=159449 RepID=UPI00099EF22F|nr:ATP-binding protein [Embleya scabrispora]MYS80908.1 ATP-binding protein [Streptomyces sp. SID5474]